MGVAENEKDIRLSREYDGEELTEKDKKRELKWLLKKFETVKDRRLASKAKEIQPWDLSVFFTEYKLPSSNAIPLKTLFIAISQLTTDTLYNKAEIAFRIHSQQIMEEQPKMTYAQLIELIDDMIITGHFSTDSLIIRRSYFPSQFGVLTSSEICEMIYDAAEVDKNELIEFEQLGQAFLKLAEGRKLWESCIGFFLPASYKPWLQVWYCSDRSHADIANAERKEKRRLKRLEKRMEKQKKNTENLQRLQNVNIDPNEEKEQSVDGLQTQTN